MKNKHTKKITTKTATEKKNKKIARDKELDRDLSNTFPASDPVTKY